MFSPPSIVTQSLLEESTSLHSFMSSDNTPETKLQDMESLENTKVSQHCNILTNPLPNLYYNQFGNLRNLRNTENQPFRIVTHLENENQTFRTLNNSEQPYRNSESPLPFRNITNIESPRTFARLNADRIKTITSNELTDSNVIGTLAPKAVLTNALVDHIYKVTNQKPSSSRIDEILTNKARGFIQKENVWPQYDARDGDMQNDDLFPDEYLIFTNSMGSNS